MADIHSVTHVFRTLPSSGVHTCKPRESRGYLISRYQRGPSRLLPLLSSQWPKTHLHWARCARSNSLCGLTSCKVSCLIPGEQGTPWKDPGQGHRVTQKHPLGVGGQSLGWFFPQNSWAALCLDGALISGDKARVLTLAPRCHVTSSTPSKPPCVSPYSHPSPIPIYPQPTCPSAALCTLSSPASTTPPSYLRDLHQCLSRSVFSALGPRAQGHG